MLHIPGLEQVPLDLALIAGRAVFLVFCFVLAAVTFTRWRRATDRNAERFFEQNSTLMQRLGRLEESLAAASRRTDQIAEQIGDENRRTAAAATTGGSAPSYQIAVRLARTGASRDELITSCGLSRQEAELVQRLHAPARPRRAAVAG
jgi:Protein of unknown function (DUF2802)